MNSQKEKEAKRKNLWIMMENLPLRFRFTTLPTVRPATTAFGGLGRRELLMHF